MLVHALVDYRCYHVPWLIFHSPENAFLYSINFVLAYSM